MSIEAVPADLPDLSINETSLEPITNRSKFLSAWQSLKLCAHVVSSETFDTLDPNKNLRFTAISAGHMIEEKCQPLRTDIRSKNIKTGAIAAASGGYTALQLGMGAFRGLSVVGLGGTAHFYELTHSPLETGGIIGGIYATYSLLAGQSMAQAVESFPNTSAKISAKAETVVKAGSKLPGFDIDSYREQSALVDSDKTTLVSKLKKHAWRGATAGLFTVNAYYGAANLGNNDLSSRRKFANRLAVDTGVMIGGMSLAAAEAITLTQVSHPIVAQTIEHNLGKPAIDYGLLAVIAGGNYALKKLGFIEPKVSGEVKTDAEWKELYSKFMPIANTIDSNINYIGFSFK